MSAISAIWSQATVPPVRVSIERMMDAQAMYGGFRRFSWSDERIALGGNLMHLLPEDVFDRQPLWTADGSACLVADVRLDNRPDLERELGLTQPETLADSAVLLAAWTRWGEACLDHIVGGFAFAVWTPARQEIFAARDHTGERPIFYHRGRNFFALASMPKGLLALPGVYRGFQQQRVIDALMLTHPDWHKSYFEGIERLPLGHLLRVRPDSFEVKPYWHPCDARPTRFKRDEEYVDALLDLLTKTTTARLRSPRGIGTQLSAGLDSSTVTAMAAGILLPQGRGLTAFTSVPRPEYRGTGLPGRLPHEGPGAADVAAMYPNVDHVLIDSARYDLLTDMKRWTDAMDEPAQNCVNLLWISAIMAEAKRRDIGVVLIGLSGNATASADGWEAMTSYFRTGRWLTLYRFARNLRLRGELSFKASGLLATEGLLPPRLKHRIRPTAHTLNLEFSPVHPDLVEQYRLAEKEFNKNYGNLPDIRTQRARFFERFDPGPMNSATRARAGLETRDPLGDKRVFEYCFSIPIEQYAVGAQSRSLIRRAMQGRLPKATLERGVRGQQGADWYLTVAEALTSFERELPRIEESPAARSYLNLPRLTTLIQTWPESGHETHAVTDSWNYALTRGISLGYMLRSHDDAVPHPEKGPQAVEIEPKKP
jgi:asparagine synthase (glutamine-hydrolysing)